MSFLKSSSGVILARAEYLRLLGLRLMALLDAFILFWMDALSRSSFRRTRFPSELGVLLESSLGLSVPVVFVFARFWFIFLNVGSWRFLSVGNLVFVSVIVLVSC